jgi:hypothetical protein
VADRSRMLLKVALAAGIDVLEVSRVSEKTRLALSLLVLTLALGLLGDGLLGAATDVEVNR